MLRPITRPMVSPEVHAVNSPLGNMGYSDPVMTTALTTPANSQSSVIFNADGYEVVGSELQTNPTLVGTTGTTGGGGTFPTPVVATGWYVQAASGTTATATKDSSDDQVLSSAVGTSYLLDNANTVSFVAGQFYKGEVLVDKVVGTCQITVIKNDGTNVQAAAFTATMGVNRFWFKAASTAVGTIRVNVPANGSITIRTASIKQVTSPLNCLRASINTGTGTASLIQRVAGVETSLISAAVPAMNKNYAPTGCCTDPDWDLDRYDGYNGAGAWAAGSGWTVGASALLTSEDNGRTGNCLRIKENGANNPAATRLITVKPGEIWNYAGFIKAGTGSIYNFLVQDVTGGYATISTYQAEETAGVWSTSYSTNITVPAGCVQIQIQIKCIASSGAGVYVDFDDITFTKTSTDDPTIVVDKTPEVLTGLSLAPLNCCTDPLNDVGVTTGWGAANAATTISAPLSGKTGYCLRVETNGTNYGFATRSSIPVEPGRVYNLNCYVNAGSATTYSVQLKDQSHSYAVLYNTGVLTASSGWVTHVSGTILIPDGCFLVHIELINRVISSGVYIDFDDISFIRTAVAPQSVVSMYHDGAQVGTSQTILNATILASKNHFLSGDFGSSLLKKRRFALGSELSSGTTSANKAYKITATQANYFFTGCAIGNIFMTNTAKTFDANNKAQEVILP